MNVLDNIDLELSSCLVELVFTNKNECDVYLEFSILESDNTSIIISGWVSIPPSGQTIFYLGETLKQFVNPNSCRVKIYSIDQDWRYFNLDPRNKNTERISLYVVGFNSPDQFESLIKSMIDYDSDFLEKPKKYLLNNSTDQTLYTQYEYLCQKYDFEILGNGTNLGICGGRQFIAEHFEQSSSEYMFFFEDDMIFYTEDQKTCRNGLSRYVDSLYKKSLNIASNNYFDFLKLNFTECYSDHSKQWVWHYYSESYRKIKWPNNIQNLPDTDFNKIKTQEGLSFALGEIYYSNWPQIVSKVGNRKMFLEKKWDKPLESLWMIHIYEKTLEGYINPGLLLLTPTEHNRFDQYDQNIRKES